MTTPGTTANAGARDALDDVLTPEQRRFYDSAMCISSYPTFALPGIIRDLARRLATAEGERDTLRKAAHWLASHAPGTPVPEWVDAAVNGLSKS